MYHLHILREPMGKLGAAMAGLGVPMASFSYAQLSGWGSAIGVAITAVGLAIVGVVAKSNGARIQGRLDARLADAPGAGARDRPWPGSSSPWSATSSRKRSDDDRSPCPAPRKESHE